MGLFSLFNAKDKTQNKYQAAYLISFLYSLYYFFIACISYVNSTKIISFLFVGHFLFTALLWFAQKQKKRNGNFLAWFLILSNYIFIYLFDTGIMPYTENNQLTFQISYIHYIFIAASAMFLFENNKNLNMAFLSLILCFLMCLSNVAPLQLFKPILPYYKPLFDIVFIIIISINFVMQISNNLRFANSNLVSSHNMFNNFLSHTADYVLVFERNYRIKFYNYSLQKIFNQLLNIDIYNGINIFETKGNVKFLTELRMQLDSAFAGNSFHYTFKGQSNVLSLIEHIDFIFSPIKNEINEVSGVAVIGVNLDEKKKKEKEVFVNEQRLSKALYGSKEGVWDWDIISGNLFISDEWKSILGYEPDDLRERIETLNDLIYIEDKEFVLKQISKHLNGEINFYNVEYRMWCKDGTLKWVESKGKIIEYYPDNSPRRFTGVLTDITEKKLNANKVEELKNFYETILENDPTGIAVYDKKQTMIYCNPASMSEPEKRKIVMYKHYNDIMKMYFRSIDIYNNRVDMMHRTILSKMEHTWEEEYESENGYVYMVRKLIPIISEDNSLLYVIDVSIDITEQKMFAKELTKAKETAENAVMVKQQFLSTISHEIRTPMNGILGLTNIMLDENPKIEQLENLSILKTSTEMLISLVNDILDVSKIEAGKITLLNHLFDLKLQMLSTIRIHEIISKNKGIRIQTIISEDLPKYINGDSLRLTQILNNLIHNALKFTNEGGEVIVKVLLKDKSERRCNIYFEVRDNGIGVSKKQQKQIFEMFSQASPEINRRYGGTGLGLAIIKRLLNLMGSDINLESELNQGSKFSFTVNFEYSNILIEGKEIEPAQDGTFNFDGKHILIAEDNTTNVIIFKKYMKKVKANVTHAINGLEAVQKCNTQKFDLILMDIQMPEMDGYQASRAIKNNNDNPNFNTPIIAVTADVTNEVKENCNEIGINSIVTKPFNPEFLYITMKKEMGITNDSISMN